MDKTSEKQRLAKLWLDGKVNESKLRKVLTSEEMKDLKFGKKWIEETVLEACR
ncbi:MAG TPA: hypothetical protein VJB66_05235 [Candidatus Nanoarchaeia archaeon]|nr:hypothetical protein [Candidatus Nanoarchaeia archaeon]